MKLILICATTAVLNTSGLPWNKFDNKNLEKAKTRCSELYSDSPCLKSFHKTEEKVYRAICSGKKFLVKD